MAFRTFNYKNSMKFLLAILCICQISALDRNWWKHATIYEVYVASFKDSNGDGYGDLKGITSKLDYLKELGVDIIWLTPIHSSPMLDTGYDVSNYTDINPIFGTITDFNDLVQQMKIRGLRLIMDLVINHSSNQHNWFQKSINREDPYTNYYVWKDPKGYYANGRPIEPNNWLSLFGPLAWTWNEKRKQFYYHVFLPEQPDLNLRNWFVKNEIKKVIRFWVNKGVYGMRLDAVSWYMEDLSFGNEEYYDKSNKNRTQIGYHELIHNKTFDIDGTYSFVRELRSYVDKLNAEVNKEERILIAEAWGTEKQVKEYYGNSTHPGVHFPFNFEFALQWDYLSPDSFRQIINKWFRMTPNGVAYNWLIDSHDIKRAISKYGEEYTCCLLALVTQLPGVTTIYYGSEIGMTSGVIRPEQQRLFREYSRTPMQWDGSLNGGFTTNRKSWLPVNPNYWRRNVKIQNVTQNSLYHFVKDLLKLKKLETIKYGSFNQYILSKWVYVMKRSYKKRPTYFIVFNMGTEYEVVRLNSKIDEVPVRLKVYMASRNSGFKKKMIVMKKKKRSFVMEPMSAVVVSPKKLKFLLQWI